MSTDQGIVHTQVVALPPAVLRRPLAFRTVGTHRHRITSWCYEVPSTFNSAHLPTTRTTLSVWLPLETGRLPKARPPRGTLLKKRGAERARQREAREGVQASFSAAQDGHGVYANATSKVPGDSLGGARGAVERARVRAFLLGGSDCSLPRSCPRRSWSYRNCLAP